MHAEVDLEADRPYALVIEYCNSGRAPVPGMQFGVLPPQPEDMFRRAVAAASDADLVVCVVGTTEEWESEGYDRSDMRLPGRQDELVAAVSTANPRTIVVLNTGAPVEMPWVTQPAAILQAWFPGQEFGGALTDILFGDANPSGKLPTTFPVHLRDVPAMASYPGEDGEVAYTERLHVGYRGFDARNIKPLFPFGHGLSYTTFDYGEPVVEFDGEDRVRVSVPVTNTGDRDGQETVQLYVGNGNTIDGTPPQELKGFVKLNLAPGEVQTAEFTLNVRAFSSYDVERQTWARKPGPFELRLGASSRDMRAVATLPN